MVEDEPAARGAFFQNLKVQAQAVLSEIPCRVRPESFAPASPKCRFPDRFREFLVVTLVEMEMGGTEAAKSYMPRIAERIKRAERTVVDGRQCVQRTKKRVQESLLILRLAREMRERGQSGKEAGSDF